jgi:predicted HTH domain antitoxin
VDKLALLAKHAGNRESILEDARRRGEATSKTMSVRMDRENYDFLREMTKAEGSDLSKAVRDLVTRGRILLAVERYKKGEASLGRAVELAGVPFGQMMTILEEFGVESRIEKEDDSRGLKNLQKVW